MYQNITSLISLLSTYDYMNASVDSLCNKISDRNCSNYNYLSKTKNKWWLLNGTNENTYEVYSSNASGVISLDAANNKKFLRPVVAIPTHMLYKSGNGTSDDIIKTKSRRSVSDFRRRTAHPLYMGTGNGRRKNVGKSRRNHRNGPGTDPDRGIQQYCVSLSAGGDERIPKIISGN